MVFHLSSMILPNRNLWVQGIWTQLVSHVWGYPNCQSQFEIVEGLKPMLTKPCLTHSFQNSSVPGFPGSDSSQILPVHNVWRAFKSQKKNRPVTTVDGSGPNKTPRKTSPSAPLRHNKTEGLPLLSPSTVVANGPDRLAPVLLALVTEMSVSRLTQKKENRESTPQKTRKMMIVRESPW